MKKLSHTDPQGRARMVDVGEKDVQQRVAKASGFISLSGETLVLIRENAMKKGDVLTVAEIAGVVAAKKTAELIPLCHNLALDKILVTAVAGDYGITITSEVHCTGKTGVEMEALTAVSVGLLTVYDMCKAVDKSMEIGQVKQIEKTKTDLHY
ncbi:MAG TPA: cyclic pyranopterin monophosphate synthase MoaC [Bacteroidales bacterium]|nr:cyclic pyranopterin monophosphate synthase MoaC [Bacteroidales bacterium]